MTNPLDSWWIGKRLPLPDGSLGEIIYVHSDDPNKGYLKCDVRTEDRDILYVELFYRRPPRTAH